jgi:tRNA(Ile)-lysidine synthase
MKTGRNNSSVKTLYGNFTDFIASAEIYRDTGKLLLGVSGGVDSMVMLSLFLRAGYSVSVAHCNFRLRGSESEADMEFVSEYCEKNSVFLHAQNFDTAAYAADNRISLQMAARELRYSWFDRLKAENNYACIAIAHNKDDLTETFLINLIRGTGIRGLTGIRARSGSIIRPLLFAGREEILAYATCQNVPYREDSSNREIKYRRNRIRHRIIPEFESISPAFTDTVFETAGRLRDVETIYNDTVTKKFEELCIKSGHGYKLSISDLKALDPLNAFLYEFLRRWNFPRESIPDIASSLQTISGKQFYSPTHRLIRDRDYLLISSRTEKSGNKYYIEEGETDISQPLKLKLTRTENHPGFVIPVEPHIACLDLDMLHFPLILRRWQKGDYFQPLGMDGLKKISDFFIDNKFSLLEKEKTWILTSGNKVAWVVGHRIDNRFRIKSMTRNILLIKIIQDESP